MTVDDGPAIFEKINEHVLPLSLMTQADGARLASTCTRMAGHRGCFLMVDR